MVSILAIGYHACDVVVSVSGGVDPDSKQEVASILLGGGGPAATAAVALAKLGARVRLVCPLTEDLPGQVQRQELIGAGVDVSLCPVRADCASPMAVILVDSARQERTIYWSRGALPALNYGEISEAWLDDTDLLYTDGHEPEASLRLARAAQRRGLPVVMDAGGVREGSAELVAACSDVISSSTFATVLTGKKQYENALQALRGMGPRRVAMTFGRAGCLALIEDRMEHIPAFAVPVCDTTGAGDVFHAGYAFARARGETWRDCLVFGSAAAALKCRDWGGRRGLPSLAEIHRLIREGHRRQERPPTA